LYPNRNPASLNTLGYDSDIFELNNNNNTLIPNGATSAAFTLATTQDTYQAFLAAFSIENIVPQIRNIKEVFQPSDLNTVFNNNPVNLGDALVYRLTLSNIGNENIDPDIPIIVDDILAANVNLLTIDGIDVAQEPSGTLISNPTISYTTTGVGSGGAQSIRFEIPPNLLLLPDPALGIEQGEVILEFLVELVARCEDLRDACSDVISNVAVTTYTGELSGIQIVDDPSSSSFSMIG